MINLSNVSKYFGTQDVLNGIDIQINEYEKIGIVGPNGQGKSTFFNRLLSQRQSIVGRRDDIRLQHSYLSPVALVLFAIRLPWNQITCPTTQRSARHSQAGRIHEFF